MVADEGTRKLPDQQMDADDPTMRRTEMLVTGGDVRDLPAGEEPPAGQSAPAASPDAADPPETAERPDAQP